MLRKVKAATVPEAAAAVANAVAQKHRERAR
jgi:hypothetical protein